MQERLGTSRLVKLARNEEVPRLLMIKEDIRLALDNLKFFRAIYSNFKVSSVLTAKNGKKYTGVNIESASYTPTICVERTAFFKAVSEGVRIWKHSYSWW